MDNSRLIPIPNIEVGMTISIAYLAEYTNEIVKKGAVYKMVFYNCLSIKCRYNYDIKESTFIIQEVEKARDVTEIVYICHHCGEEDSMMLSHSDSPYIFLCTHSIFI